MKITVSSVQFQPKAGCIEENLEQIESFVKKAVSLGSGLIVLPEISDTGYNLDIIKNMATSFPNLSTNRLSEIAKKYHIIIVAGLAEKRNGELYNIAAVFDTNGKLVSQYAKTHLCPYPSMNEPAYFKPGQSIFVTNVEGIKIGTTICYDIRFPEIYRKLALAGAQIITNSAAFPKIRINHLEICLKSRAIENQVFLVSSNHSGKIGDAVFGGRSMIVGPGGDVRAKASDTDDELITATLDLDEIEIIRKERPVITQRRPEIY